MRVEEGAELEEAAEDSARAAGEEARGVGAAAVGEWEGAVEREGEGAAVGGEEVGGGDGDGRGRRGGWRGGVEGRGEDADCPGTFGGGVVLRRAGVVGVREEEGGERQVEAVGLGRGGEVCGREGSAGQGDMGTGEARAERRTFFAREAEHGEVLGFGEGCDDGGCEMGVFPLEQLLNHLWVGVVRPVGHAQISGAVRYARRDGARTCSAPRPTARPPARRGVRGGRRGRGPLRRGRGRWPRWGTRRHGGSSRCRRRGSRMVFEGRCGRRSGPGRIGGAASRWLRLERG